MKEQFKKQGALLENILGVKAQSVWNTELLYTDEIAYKLNKCTKDIQREEI